MGKNSWRKKRKREDAANRLERKAEAEKKGERLSYPDIIKENKDFEKYYQLQNICPPAEWDQFMECIRQPLPTTFRITGSRGPAAALVDIIENKLIKGVAVDVEELTEQSGAGENGTFPAGEEIERPFPFQWYPDKLAWQINLTKKAIRRSETLFKLHNFLICENESGNMTRQEAVSMIPPLCLDVKSHHKVLDMCAAPGSKSAQLIEMLHSNDKAPEGFLIANDMDNRRCYMLVHQAKRLQSSAFIITNHDASMYPDVFVTNSDDKKVPLKFDRVLCDVPCSGDGTIRKNIDVWKKWSTANGLYLHMAQHMILKRGLELLAVDGLLVYSTCSLNPCENEAVISRILKECKGSVELADINLPHLKRSPGLSHWTPCSRDMKSYSSVSEVKHPWINVVRDYHFPPEPSEAASFHLEKCVRVLPHHQNTGAFFVALLRKTKTLPWEKPPELPKYIAEQLAQESARVTPSPHKLRKMHGYKEDPYVFLEESDEIWAPVREFYHLDESLNSTHFLSRTVEGKKRNIYFTTGLVRNVVRANEGILKIVNTGVKTFVRADNKWTSCNFRLAQDGLQSLMPFIKGRKIEISQEDMLILLYNDSPDNPPPFPELSDSTQEQLKVVERGSVILIMNSEGIEGGPAFRLELIGWRGNTSLRAYVSLNERMHYLRLCGGDCSKFEKNKFTQRAEENGKGDLTKDTSELIADAESMECLATEDIIKEEEEEEEDSTL